MTGREKALDRARKLAAIAKDQDGTPEGVTAAGLAKGLQERWGFTDEEMDPPREEPVVIRRVNLTFRKPEVHARAMLLAVLAEIAGCYSTYRAGSEGEGWVGRVYGSEDRKIAMVILMFDTVENKVEAEIRRSPRTREALTGYDNLVKRNKGKPEFLATIERARDTFYRGLLVNWTMTVAVELKRIWAKREGPEEPLRVEIPGAQGPQEPKAPEAPQAPKAPETSESALVVSNTALGSTSAAAKGFGDKLKAAAQKATRETWTFDEDAAEFARAMGADLRFDDNEGAA